MEAIAVENHVVTPASGSVPGALAINDLFALESQDLERLYQAASVPAIRALDGDLRGHVLALQKLPAALASLASRWTGSNMFPWRGKTFTAMTDTEGRGINRLVSDRFRVLPFHTFVGKSRAGDFDAMQLNYDLPENPFFIRAIKDEIRELRPNLYLGQAYVALKNGTHLALYFGLTSDQ